MSLTVGSRLGPYEILSAIGAGGMGEVYRARDTKLNREVALKVLPEAFTRDPDRLSRFRREAQVLASLNHPHIGAIYGFEDSGETHALVLELVEGDTLADRIARGPIPAEEALPMARQIGEALEAAHEQGIIHRDLKPANIKVTPEGVVKVLDFGLAKLADPAGSGQSAAVSTPLSMSPTITSPAMMTGVGMLLGTAAYMSPEQAKGRVADKRSDVWAFGAVLYEMLTGTRAFGGEDVSDILASVLKSEPDWTALPADVPALICTLVKRCLKKDRTRRVTDIGAALFVIDEQNRLGPSAPTAASLPLQMASLWKRATLVLVVAVVAAALASAVTWSLRPSTPSPTITRFSLPLPQGQAFTNVNRRFVAVSPDGTQMSYSANARLYLRSMSDLEARPIPGTEGSTGVSNPVFSPDGRSIAFGALDRTLKRISTSGGAAVTICPAVDPYGMSWGGDGIAFTQVRSVMRVSPNGGKPELLISLGNDESASDPQMLPGGQAVLFALAKGTSSDRWDKAQVVVQSLKSGERKTLVEGGSDARYVPTGHLVYALGGTVFAVPFDLRRLQVMGGPVPVVDGVRRISNPGPNAGSAQFSFSDTGSLIYVPGPGGASSAGLALVLADRKGTTEILKLPPGSYEHPRVSPDGKRLAFGTNDGKEATVWIYDLAGTSAMRRLTFGGRNQFPVWSADGQRIAFQSDREGHLGIFWQRADGTGAAERLTKPDQGTSHVPQSWSPDGKRFLFEVTQGSKTSLWMFLLEDKKAAPFGGVQSSNPVSAAFSPDGRWVAYHSDESGSDAIYVQPFPATGAKYQISKSDLTQNDHHPAWAPDGKELFYIPAVGALAAVSVTTQPSFTFGSTLPVPRRFTENGSNVVERNYDLTPDGRIVGLVLASEQTLTGTPTPPEIRVVLNWTEELKRLVPTR